MSYRIKTDCRACGGTDLAPVFGLGNQPLANDHVKPDEARQGFYPLTLNRCVTCGQAQLSVVVNPLQLYGRYSYVTSGSDTMRRHFSRLLNDLASENVENSVVEIGSNDGRLLHFFRANGYAGLGIDPAANLAALAAARGVETINDFFSVVSAGEAKQRVPEPGVILARHCFAHMDDWRGFFAAAEVLAGKETLVCLEVPYVKDLLDRVELDSIYHEHLSYVSVKPLVRLLNQTPFQLHRVIRYGIHGGALLLMLRRRDAGHEPHLSAEEFVADEVMGDRPDMWEQFGIEAREKILRLGATVRQKVSEGKIVSAFGASAKASVLINACGFTRKEIAFVTDNSPLKPGCLVPGTDIPIIEEGQMLSEHPDYAVLTAWNYREEIMAKQEKWRQRGGRFIVPGRTLEIV